MRLARGCNLPINPCPSSTLKKAPPQRGLFYGRLMHLSLRGFKAAVRCLRLKSGRFWSWKHVHAVECAPGLERRSFHNAHRSATATHRGVPVVVFRAPAASAQMTAANLAREFSNDARAHDRMTG